jgi:hypothetical protein
VKCELSPCSSEDEVRVEEEEKFGGREIWRERGVVEERLVG